VALPSLRILFDRDLHKLKTEIQLYNHEAKLWIVENRIANSAGNLCLHLVGNLNAYIGAVLGDTGYIRKREEEFSLKNIPRITLIREIENTILVVKNTLDKLSEPDLQKEFPLLIFKEKTSTEYLLIHLSTHLGYHLGQINYHRRLLDDPVE
jgi:uncharacterized damage-inducible protein DinB